MDPEIAQTVAHDLPETRPHMLAKVGEYPASIEAVGGGRIHFVQEVTQEVLESLANDLNAKMATPDWTGVLLDFDHGSEDLDKSSEAAGWYKGPFVVRDGALYAVPELTPQGADAIRSKRFKRLSPVLSVPSRSVGEGKKIKPVRLVSVALTNKPNMPDLAPVANRQTPTQGSKPMNEQLLKALGLAADATPEQAVEAVNVLNRKVTDLESLELARAADAFVATHGAKFSDAAKARELFVANRKAAEDAAALIAVPAKPAPETEARVLHRDQTKAPEGVVETPAPSTVNVANRARELCASRKLPWAQAWDLAAQEAKATT
jgi:hypothetical protein